MAWYLSREYANTVQVNYNDLSRPSVRQEYPAMVERLQQGELVLPAVYVDGEIAGEGYVDYFSISKAVEKARKAISN